MEQSFISDLESCDSCYIYCGNKLLQCLLHFPLNPDVTVFIWGFLQPKSWPHLSHSVARLSFIWLCRRSSKWLHEQTPHHSVYFGSDTYGKCNISHALVVSSHARYIIQKWSHSSSIIKIVWHQHLSSFLATAKKHVFCFHNSSIFHLVETRLIAYEIYELTPSGLS